MGVIDTLSAGFALINRRIWILAIPVILDLFLWVGPSVPIGPSISRLPDRWYEVVESLNQQNQGVLFTPEDSVQIRDSLKQQTERTGNLNLFTILAVQMPSIQKPNLIEASLEDQAAVPTDGFDFGRVLPALPMMSALWLASLFTTSLALAAFGTYGLMPTVVVLWLGGLLVASSFMTGVGIYVRGDRFQPGLYFRRAMVNWSRLVLLYVVALLAGLFLGLPALMFGALLLLLNIAFGTLVLGLMLSVAAWLVVYLFYSLAAIFVGDINPLKALWHSFNIVRYDFWPSLWMVTLIATIGAGSAVGWRYLMGNQLTYSLAIIGNAYIGAGLLAASMIFYRERYAVWQKKLRAGKQVVEMNK